MLPDRSIEKQIINRSKFVDISTDMIKYTDSKGVWTEAFNDLRAPLRNRLIQFAGQRAWESAIIAHYANTEFQEVFPEEVRPEWRVAAIEDLVMMGYEVGSPLDIRYIKSRVFAALATRGLINIQRELFNEESNEQSAVAKSLLSILFTGVVLRNFSLSESEAGVGMSADQLELFLRLIKEMNSP